MVNDVNNFCTYFDINYLPRGLALERSLHSYSPQAVLWILCLDALCYESLLKLNLSNVNPIRLEDFEKGDTELTGTKEHRSQVEYYFTCTPSLLLYLFEHHSNLERLTYLDSDFFFFGDPTGVLLDLEESSIGITPHRFPRKLRHLEKNYGLYNVGWITIARDEQGLSCLRLWRKQCIEWCHDRLEDGKFADQMYLDDWPNCYSNLKVINHPGVNLAPYNLANYRVSAREEEILVDQFPLICFHFFGLKNYRGVVFYLSLKRYAAQPTDILLKQIYEPYLQCLARIEKELQPVLSKNIRAKSIRGITEKRPLRFSSIAQVLNKKFGYGFAVASAILQRRFVIFARKRILFGSITCGLKDSGLSPYKIEL